MTIPSSPIVPVSPAKVKATAPHPNPMESEAAVAKGDLKARRASNRNPLQRLRLERGIPVKDMVEVVQTLYPKYDKTVQSKVEHGNEYGINLRPDAMRALLNRFAPGVAPQSFGLSRDGSPKGELANSESLPPRRPSAARAPRRTKPYRVQARLSERVYGQLQRLTAQTGTTMQDFLEQLIVDFLANRKEERTHGTQVEHGGNCQEDRQPGERPEQGTL